MKSKRLLYPRAIRKGLSQVPDLGLVKKAFEEGRLLLDGRIRNNKYDASHKKKGCIY